MSGITLGQVRFLTEDDVYHYLVDNRPMQDLAANDQILKTAIEDLQQSVSGVTPATAPDAETLDGTEKFIALQGTSFVAIAVNQLVDFFTNASINQLLLQWAYAQAFQIVSAVRNSDEAIVSADIIWPDGITGTYGADVLSSAFPGATDAWHATYNSPKGLKSVTQPQVTRDANGAVTAQPAITIS